MEEKVRVITCRGCGMENLPERYEPLSVKLRTGEEIVVFGLPFFHCRKCDDIYTSRNQTSADALNIKIRETATLGANTVIL